MKKVKISGFQSHRNTELNLHPNVNIIVGQSSSGKTAIFRAIEWLNTNRPLGTRFISHGEKEARVSIDDAQGIKTNKGKTAYNVGEAAFDSGSNVPDLVVQKLNLSEINIQNQLDEHFLITSSPGEVARAFNKILNIEKVDEYNSKLTTQINTTNTIIKEKTEQIESLTNKLKDLDYLDEMQKEVSFVEEKTRLWIDVKDSSLELSDMIKKVRDLEITLFRDTTTFEKISKILRDFVFPMKELEKRNRLIDLLSQAIKLTHEKHQNSLIANDLKRHLARIDYSILLETKKRKNKINGGINQFDAILKVIETIEEKKKSISADINNLLTQYRFILEELKICPICLSPITDVSHIVKEVRNRYEIHIS